MITGYHTHTTHKYEHTLKKYTLSFRAFGLEYSQVETTNICRRKVLCAPLKPYYILYQYRIYSAHMTPFAFSRYERMF